jgi:SAM-dependent methyltransferase
MDRSGRVVNPPQPRLYSEFASWFHLLTAPSSYAEEAEFARQTLVDASAAPIRTVLELGSGGGNNAFHLKAHFQLTLTDLSPFMLERSRAINPQCEHIEGDMRSLRLGRQFDAVFVHDAVCHLTTKEDLIACMRTALVHCKAGGVALFMPDFVRERFRSGVHHGGHDGDGRSLRYMEWTFDANPSDNTYTNDFAYMLREGDSAVRVEHDTHINGLFSRQEWLAWLHETGFQAQMLQDPYDREVFVASRSK